MGSRRRAMDPGIGRAARRVERDGRIANRDPLGLKAL
jgi:hypothetical protein